jgi:hypothetical protein
MTDKRHRGSMHGSMIGWRETEEERRVKMKDRILLGDTVRDTFTGFTGVVTAWCEYLYSTPSLCISGAKDGIPHDEWLPEIRVKKIEQQEGKE